MSEGGKKNMKKISVVTGATGAMGFACAQIAGEKTAVLISDLEQEKIDLAVTELRNTGVEAEGMTCDVSDRSSVHALAEKAKSMGKIVAVYNVAGLSPSNGAPADRIMKVNAFGALYMNQEFQNVMDGGCLMNVASSTVYMLPKERLPYDVYDLALTNQEAFKTEMLKLASAPGISYAYSKAFVKYLTEKTAFRLGREKGIRIVSVSPGVIDTPMTQNDASNRAKAAAMSYCALGRIGTPEELAYSFTALADERNSYVTGVDLMVDGGCLAEGYDGISVRGEKQKGVSAEELARQKDGE